MRILKGELTCKKNFDAKYTAYFKEGNFFVLRRLNSLPIFKLFDDNDLTNFQKKTTFSTGISADVTGDMDIGPCNESIQETLSHFELALLTLITKY